MNYVTIDTSGRKDNRIDMTTHKLNIDRRIMERDGLFNNVTTMKPMKNKKNNTQYGNITRDKFEPLQYSGMPSRYCLTNDRILLNKKETTNKYLDFNVFNNDLDEDYSENSLNNEPIVNNTFNYENLNNLTYYLFNDIFSKTNSKEKIIISPLNIFICLFSLGFNNPKPILDIFGLDKSYNLYEICVNTKNILENCSYIDTKNILYMSNNCNTPMSPKVKEVMIIDKYDNTNLRSEITRINTILSNMTNRLINNIIYGIDKYIQTIYINTFILKTNWNFYCSSRDTYIDYFNNLNGKQKTKMIVFKDITVRQSKNIYELDLLNEFVFGIYTNCNTFNINNVLNNIDNLVHVDYKTFIIPKFKYHCRYKMNNILNKLGLSMNNKSILHNCVIFINEGTYSLKNETKNTTKKFILHDPFIFYIRDKSTNLFITIGYYS